MDVKVNNKYLDGLYEFSYELEIDGYMFDAETLVDGYNYDTNVLDKPLKTSLQVEVVDPCKTVPLQESFQRLYLHALVGGAGIT